MDYIADATELNAFTRKGTTMVLFGAAWCKPCAKLTANIRAAETSATLGPIPPVAKVDIDESPALAQEFGIMGVPALFVFEDGVVVDEYRGNVPFATIVRKYV